MIFSEMVWVNGNIKQLLDEVCVISRIIKVEVGVISQSRRLRVIILTKILIIVLLYIEQNKMEVMVLLLHW